MMRSALTLSRFMHKRRSEIESNDDELDDD